MNTQSIFKIFIALFGLFFLSLANASTWQALKPGIMYQDISPIYIRDWSHIHVFKIDPKLFSFELIEKKQTEKMFPTINQYAEIKNANLTFNAGFFDANLSPLGLRISHYKKINNFKNISWWGVFYIKNQRPYISSAKQFSLSKDIEFAVQSGPRLIANGKTISVKGGYAERTALCILPNHEIAVVITQYFPMTLSQLGQMLSTESLACQDAINLDGGSSTQFSAKFSGFHLHMPGLAAVSDAIAVVPRS
jgi:uncharacterized protein YigE (DUF2233 family)